MTGNKLREIRKTKLFKIDKFGINVPLTQKDLAAALGYSRFWIVRAESQRENDISPNLELALRGYMKLQRMKKIEEKK
jgi:DNA-binding XRE family transcriptional regulator